MGWKKLRSMMLAALLALPLAFAPTAQAQLFGDYDYYGYYDDDVYDEFGWDYDYDYGYDVGDTYGYGYGYGYDYDDDWFGNGWSFDDDDWWL
jgi:hypothetical protein